jgi:uncharacterized protein DUF5678
LTIDTQAVLARFRRDREYFDARYPELLRTYPEQWVAVFNQELVGADADFERLLSTIEQQGVPPGQALVRFVTTRNDILILPA